MHRTLYHGTDSKEIFIHLVGKWHKKLQVIDDEWNDTHFRSLEEAVVTVFGYIFPYARDPPHVEAPAQSYTAFLLNCLSDIYYLLAYHKWWKAMGWCPAIGGHVKTLAIPRGVFIQPVKHV